MLEVLQPGVGIVYSELVGGGAEDIERGDDCLYTSHGAVRDFGRGRRREQ